MKTDLSEYSFISLRERPELEPVAAGWFSDKWGVPEQAYRECMDAYLSRKTEYGWYLCLCENEIVAGLGVIDNDFHDAPECAPNVCAVYTDPVHRGRGIMGKLLNMAVGELSAHGITPVYLVTDHVGLYERYGWEFARTVTSLSDGCRTRLYIHKGGTDT